MTKSMQVALFAALVLVAAPARAVEHPPLTPLPREKLAALAPLLRAGDMALIESDDKGWERQVTTITLVGAAPEVVREVVIHPERYSEFVRNIKESRVEPRPDGTFDYHWKLNYVVDDFAGVNRYVMHDDVVDTYDLTGPSNYRWEFIPSTVGGGTIVVVYGYTDMRHSGGFVEKLLKRASTLEHGLALTTQMLLLLAAKQRAERAPGTFAPYAVAAGQHMPSYQFLLDRGTVALFHRQAGRLSGISLIDRARAVPSTLMHAAADLGKWSSFVPSIGRSNDLAPREGYATAEVEQSIPLMSWTTTWWVRAAANAVDMFGTAGDLRGARMRWDARPLPDGKSELVLRASQSYDKESVVMRQLYKLEPLFEYGVNVGLDLVVMRGIKDRAEQLDVQNARR
jgi:hypothetical protein